MKKLRLAWIILFIFPLLNSCQKEEFQLSASQGKLKIKYIYSSSKDNDPYAYTEYYYDKSWNLIKDVVVVKPDPITFKNTYKYLEGKLIEKNHYGVPQGSSPMGLTESDLTLYDKYLYNYPSADITIEKRYNMEKNSLKDSVIYEYMDDLLIKESHYNRKDNFEWEKNYEYDQEGNLIKETNIPDGTYSVYIYQNGKRIKALGYDKNDTLITESQYVYKKKNGYDVMEIHYSGPYGKFISSKSLSKNGLLVEYILYHPTFIGEEWYCERYEYF